MISILGPRAWVLLMRSMGSNSRRSPFPKGIFIRGRDRKALAGAEKLREVVDELSPIVHSKWQQSPEDQLLLRASASLTIAGGSLQGVVLALGPFALTRMMPYWTHRQLLEDELVVHLADVLDDHAQDLLQVALTLDGLIRKLQRDGVQNLV